MEACIVMVTAGVVFAVKASTSSLALAFGGTIKYKKGNTGLG